MRGTASLAVAASPRRTGATSACTRDAQSRALLAEPPSSQTSGSPRSEFRPPTTGAAPRRAVRQQSILVDRAFARWDSRDRAQDTRVALGRLFTTCQNSHPLLGFDPPGVDVEDLAPDFASCSPLALGRTSRAVAGASGSQSVLVATVVPPVARTSELPHPRGFPTLVQQPGPAGFVPSGSWFRL